MMVFRVKGTDYPFDERDDYTFGELEAMANLAPGGDLANISANDPRMMMALTYVAMSRSNRGVTLTDVRQLKVSDVEVIVQDESPLESVPANATSS
jgi:hypothetical protein